MSQLSLVDEMLGREFMTPEFILECLSLGRHGEFRESLLTFDGLQVLQIKTVIMPKQHILGGISCYPSEACSDERKVI